MSVFSMVAVMSCSHSECPMMMTHTVLVAQSGATVGSAAMRAEVAQCLRDCGDFSDPEITQHLAEVGTLPGNVLGAHRLTFSSRETHKCDFEKAVAVTCW